MAGVLSKEQVNMGRQFEVDVAKVFAIFTMVLVHVYEQWETLVIMGEPLRNVIEFMGGPLSAPIFMTAMGIGIAYSRRQEAAFLAHRGLILFAQGYLLNLLRGGLSNLTAYYVYGEPQYLQAVGKRMLELDILQFAGGAFLLFALLRLLKAKDWQILLVGVLMLAAATVMEPSGEGTTLWRRILDFFFRENVDDGFPLFSWFIYPAAGYCFGHLLMRVQDKKQFYLRLLGLMVPAFILFTVVLWLTGYNIMDIFMGTEYYRQTLIKGTWILMTSAMVYGVCYFVALLVPQEGAVRRWLTFISNKLNNVYMTQWVLIWWIFLFPLHGVVLTTPAMLALVLVILVASVLLAYGQCVWSEKRNAAKA